MARKTSYNPLAFQPTQVTLIASAIYVALFTILLWNHHAVPPSPNDPVPFKGINLTTAWLDLDFISDGFHPWGSRRNGVVREFLIERVRGIVGENGGEIGVVGLGEVQGEKKKGKKGEDGQHEVVLFVDDVSNVTFASGVPGLQEEMVRYQESKNLMVYIRGTEDDDGDWWVDGGRYGGEHGGVLVNAHYDSVSTGYGATDDGVGVATVLQLISYFTTEGHKPKHGIVALLNDGEENGLYGAHSYLQHPISSFPHTFLNLEGAGAGGRATLFRSTDAEVTKFYGSSPYPFGSVVSADGFKRGLIRSGTDYSVFTEDAGMRGLDVAFMEPRARYHTDEDDVKNTSEESLWHMLSAALETMKGLTSYDGTQFNGELNDKGRLGLRRGNEGVWWDIFGRTFAILELQTLFALSVTLLVAAPVILIVVEAILVRSDKWYPFARKQYLHNADDDEAVQFGGFRGFFRTPIAFIFASTAVAALAFLMAKINPVVVYSSEYAVWAMMLCAWFSVAWFILAGADRVRPTALGRLFSFLWLYAFSWVLVVGATVGENNLHVASGYFLIIYNASMFVALLISYFELFALPTKRRYVEHVAGKPDPFDGQSRRSVSITRRPGRSTSRAQGNRDDADEANERTSLLDGGDQRDQNTFSRYGRQRHPEGDGALEETQDPLLTSAHGDEQAWSSSLVQWTWLIQFLIVVPINLILVGQLALLMTSAVHQTPADGNPVLPIYMLFAIMGVLLLLPLMPFLHRVTYHVPTFLFLIFIGCLVYNLLAFPFSRDARMKFYFVQSVDVETGGNRVALTGIDGYLQDIIAELPSAAGQHVKCGETSWPTATREGLQTCTWHGLTPNVAPFGDASASTSHLPAYANHTVPTYRALNITSPAPSTPKDNSTALITFWAANSKSARLIFDPDHPITRLRILNASDPDPRYRRVSTEHPAAEVRLFSRDFEKEFALEVGWEGGAAKGKKGRVEFLWDDVDLPVKGGDSAIPALNEVWRFAPVWSVPSKAGDGLVEGVREFVV